MLQEPKSKQSKLAQVYKLTVLNHTLLSSAFFRNLYSVKRLKLQKHLMLYLIKLLKNLDSAITILKEGDVVPETNPINDDLSIGLLN
jgi:hypothetical protein